MRETGIAKDVLRLIADRLTIAGDDSRDYRARIARRGGDDAARESKARALDRASRPRAQRRVFLGDRRRRRLRKSDRAGPQEIEMPRKIIAARRRRLGRRRQATRQFDLLARQNLERFSPP